MSERLSFRTLIEMLQYRANHHTDETAFIFLADEEKEYSITYAQLAEQAKAIAAALQKRTQPGDRAILIYPPGLEFIAAFFGCLYAGVIAVPAYPPVNIMLVEKLQKMIIDSQPQLILTTENISKKMYKLKITKAFSRIPGLNQLIKSYWKRIFDLVQWDLNKMKFLSADQLPLTSAKEWKSYSCSEDDLAFLQYTSGSTNIPKGVMVSHGNLLHNINLMHEKILKRHSLVASWLPASHDMGLIGTILTPIYTGIPSVLMSPIRFLQNPITWLEAISKHKASISVAPNFAYEYCISKISEEQKDKLELSHWKQTLNGAEPVQAATLENFYIAFKRCGLRKNIFSPSYGLAEATLYVCCPPTAEPYHVLNLEKEALQGHKVELKNNSNQADSKLIVGCGIPSQTVRIVDPNTAIECAEDEVGEIWITSPSVGMGYWGKKEETIQTFKAQIKNAKDHTTYLRTGDLGFQHQGELFVTGRLKDLIIIHGRNYYPQDIELTVQESHPAIRVGCMAAFTLLENAEEKLVVVCEINLPRAINIQTYKNMTDHIREAVAHHHELAVHDIVLIPPKKIPKTTSGKIRRSETKNLYLANKLPIYYSWSLGNQNKINSYTPPKTQLQIQLCDTYAKLLKNSQVGVTDNFFSLGGDSLLVAQLISQIENKFGIKIDPEKFYNEPTVSNLAALIKNAKKISGDVGSNVITQQTRSGDIPLSLTQEGIWFLHQFNPDNPFYNLSLSLHFKGKIEILFLEQAFAALIKKYEILRTCFPNKNGIPYQKIEQPNPVQIPIYNLQQLPVKTRGSEIDKIRKIIAYQPFNLTKGPLIRLALIQLEMEETMLLVTVHHIIADGWSLKIFAQEISVLYNTLTNNKPLPTEQSALQYADFSIWQRSQENMQRLEKDLAYWRQQLTGAPAYLKIKTDKSRPVVSSYRGGTVDFTISSVNLRQLRAFAQEQNATLFMIFLATFQLLLYRYTGQEDIITGIPIANRSRYELQKMIGFVANTLPIRIQCKADSTFKDLVDKVRQVMTEAFAHQEVPFEKIVEGLHLERRANLTPLFQTMLVLQDFRDVHLNLNALKSHLILDSVMAKFDMTFEFIEDEKGMQGRLVYAKDLFTHETAERLVNYFQTILNTVHKHPALPLEKINLLTPEDRANILIDWNRTEKNYAGSKILSKLFEAQVEISQNHTAVEDESQAITYLKLNQSANQLANYLKEKGVKIGDRIVILQDRDNNWIVSSLSILKLGAACVPLDPAFPEARIQFILEETHPVIILTNEKYGAKLKFQKQKIISIDKEEAEIKRYDLLFKSCHILPNDIAYVIYTSGSTGKPKGVLLTHKGLSDRINWLKTNLPLRSTDVLLHQFAFNFDASIIYLWWPLLSGVRVILPPTSRLNDIDYLAKQIILQQVTVLSSIPTVLNLMVNALENRPNRITKIISGAEIFSVKLFNKIRKIKNCDIYNLYGPTEGSVFSTFYKLPATTTHNNLPIGKPISNTQIYILDKNLQPAPIHVTGEIYIGGVGLAQGYLNRDVLNQTSFIKSPFSTNSEDRIYKTGDLGFYLPDGNVVYVGRSDYQLKINGFRIEPEEIEIILKGHPAVNEAVVIATQQNPYPQLIAFVTMKKQKKKLFGELRTYLARFIPIFMQPAVFNLLEELPKLSSGKVDREALAKYVPAQLSHQYVPPHNATELKLAGIWEEILNHHPISITTNFFFAGGNSLLALQLLTKIKTLFQIDMAIESLFEYQTIAAQADFLINKKPITLDKPGSIIHKLNQNDSAPTLFCVHPIGGSIFQYKQLAEMLDKQFSVYGIQSLGLAGESKPYCNIEKMAAYYISQMRSIQPAGPYTLLGWSMGGLIAYEMAAQLKKSGETIAGLILIDTADPDLTPHCNEMSAPLLFHHLMAMFAASAKVSSSSYSWRMKLTLFLVKIMGYSFIYLASLLSFLGFKKNGLDIKNLQQYLEMIKSDVSNLGPRTFPLNDWICFLQEHDLISNDISNTQLANFYEVFRSNLYASEHYHLPLYNENVLYFETANHHYDSEWKNHAQHIEFCKLPTDHYQVLQDKKSLDLIKKTLFEVHL